MPETKVAAPASNAELQDLLAAIDLWHLAESLATTTSLKDLLQIHGEGRPKLLMALKVAGVDRLADRQKLSSSLAKLARGEAIERKPARRDAICDLDLCKDINTPSLNINAPSLLTELARLPSLGVSAAMPGDSDVRPDAKIRLICLYGAFTDASHFADWARSAPAWLEVRAIELPGHGARTAEGVWAMGRQAKQGIAEQEVVGAIADERAAAVASLLEAIEPLCHARYALYGFSSGAMLAYLMAAEIQHRQQAGRWPARLPFRLFVCGRGAPHAVHVSSAFTLTLRCGSDVEVMDLMHSVLGVPVESDAAELKAQAALWRAAIVPAMVSVPPRASSTDVPPFPLPPADESTCRDANPYVENAPSIRVCPVVAIGSVVDKVWRWGQPARWADVATAGFRLIGVEDVPHFKLMCSPPVLEAVLRELGAAALAHARFDT